jgi:hypothetical protein
MKGTIMTFKEFGEEAEIQYTTVVTVNGQVAATISGMSSESLLEDFSKLDTGIAAELQKQYEELPETEEE